MLEKTGRRINKTARPKSSPPLPHYRLVVLGIFWILGLLLVVIKLAIIQVFSHGKYEKIARGQMENRLVLPAQRGNILDRNGEVMATDLIYYSLAVRPRLLKNPESNARKIADLIQQSRNSVLQKVRTNKPFVYLAHRLTPETAEKIRALKLQGVILEKKFSRYYPYGQTGAHLLGYCDFDNHAKAGLEMGYDEFLKGTPGWSIYLRDALGNQFPNLDFPASEPVNGMHLETTIDVVYQGILDEEVKKAVEAHQAGSGSAILMNPLTGEVLGMANYPGYNPNEYNRYSMERYLNRAIIDLYEPGSTFKMVSLALCLEQLHLDMQNEVIFCENGSYLMAQKVIKDHQRYGNLTARQVFENSSNIGVIKLSKRFKAPAFYRYARDFGFGAPTGIDLPAEAGGILHKPAEYSRHSLSFMSIGYEVAVTPLQIVSAYAAVANEGRLMQPYLVRRVVDSKGKEHKEYRPRPIREVVSPETARQMKAILQGVVENGTGKNARIEGVSIAGKTGTAQKLDRNTNTFSSNSHIASFVGFFPVEAPRFVLLVVINNPRLGYYGSQVAAPAFRNIAQRIIGLPQNDLPQWDRPGEPEEKKSASVVYARADLPEVKNVMPALEGLAVNKASRMLKKKEVEYEIVGKGETVYRQEPSAYTPLSGKEKVRLFTEAAGDPRRALMPRVTGLTLKEALQVLSTWDIPVEVEGSGVVVRQLPGAGQRMQQNTKVKLVCNPT